jgi:putative transposase
LIFLSAPSRPVVVGAARNRCQRWTQATLSGLSTRNVEDALGDSTGELLISKSKVSEITDRLWADYPAFIARDLSELEAEYLFVDAVFEALRRHGAEEALLVACCIDSRWNQHRIRIEAGSRRRSP